MPDEFKDKISEDDTKAIKDAVEEAKKVLNDSSSDKEKLEEAVKTLNNVLMPIGAKMYQSNSEEKPTAEPMDNGSNDDGEAVEGEVVDNK